MKSFDFRSYWKNISSISYLSVAGLLVIATARFAYAIVAAVALIWVYCLSSLIISLCQKFLPQFGKSIVYAFLASFFSGSFILLLWFFSPLCAIETFFLISLIPMLYIASDNINSAEKCKPADAVFSSFFSSLVIGILMLIFALIREPLGFLSLSFPGGDQGITLLFSSDSDGFFPIHLIAASCGALLLLGYFLGVYEYFIKNKELNKKFKEKK
ncbi:MAG: hypothetical protein FWH41_08270 [Treponema sp.]|nr:hypothetical protein [Treponema sp.]